MRTFRHMAAIVLGPIFSVLCFGGYVFAQIRPGELYVPSMAHDSPEALKAWYENDVKPNGWVFHKYFSYSGSTGAFLLKLDRVGKVPGVWIRTEYHYPFNYGLISPDKLFLSEKNLIQFECSAHSVRFGPYYKFKENNLMPADSPLIPASDLTFRPIAPNAGVGVGDVVSLDLLYKAVCQIR